jgi:hypothetical protein
MRVVFAGMTFAERRGGEIGERQAHGAADVAQGVFVRATRI